MRTLAACAAAATISLLAPSQARADEPSCAADPKAVALRAEAIDPSLRAELTRQLHAALASRKIALCLAEDPSVAPALAGIVLSVEDSGSDAIVVTVTVRDELTAKRVARDVDLHGIPEDGRALVLAQAADELLRASWAELLVEDAPKPTREVPPEVRRAVDRADKPSSSRAAPVVEVGVGLGGEVFGTGQRQVGLDIGVLVFPTERVGALLQAGARAASSAESTSGVVDASAVVGAAGIAFSPVSRTRRLGIDVGPEVFVTRAHYETRGGPSGQARKDDATAVHGSIFARSWLAIVGPLRASASLRVGAPLHTIRVVAVNESVTGVGGIVVGGQLSLGGAW